MYYIMSSEYDAFNKPKIAKYDNNRWVVSGDAPEGFTGDVVNLTNMIDELGEPWTIEHYTALIDQMRAEPPTGRLLIIPKWVGRHLHKNHPAFMPAQTEI